MANFNFQQYVAPVQSVHTSTAGGDGGHAVVGASQDVHVSNSFSDVGNEDNDFTVIKNSFNQDNDGVDNSHGHIVDSVVAGDDISHSMNSDDDVHQ